MFTRHPVRVFLVLLIGWVALLDGLAGAYFIPKEGAGVRVAHHYYHHGFRPLQEVRATWGDALYDLRTNSLGMRDATARDVALLSPKQRIVLMGDSFAEGIGVDYDETVAGLLARSLGEQYEVLNAAVVSYSPKLYFLKTRYLIEKVGLRFDRLIVFADLSDVMNEVSYNLDFQPTEDDPGSHLSHRIHTWLIGRSYLYRTAAARPHSGRRTWVWDRDFLREALREKTPREVFRDTLNNPDGSWPDTYPHDAVAGMRLCLIYMEELVALCRRNGITMDLVVYPWPRQVFTRLPDDRYRAMWRDFANERGITLVDCYPEFITPERSSEETYASFFIPGDIHWNPRGHGLVADKLLTVLGRHQSSLFSPAVAAF